jgi:imidazolonepropionase-like amidohydrolase
VNFEGSLLIPKEKAAAMVDDFRGTFDSRRKLVSGYLLDDWKEQLAERTPEYEDQIQKALPGMVRDSKEMHQAGVRMLPGTDVGVALIYPGFSLHDELAALVKHVGLTPAEALIAATKNAASWFGMEKRVGTIQRGMTADLVVLDADPLTDIQNTKKIRAVIQAGRLYERDDLDKLLRQAESAAKAETTSRLKRLEGQPQMNADQRR